MSSRSSVFRELIPPPDVLETFESVLRLPYPILFDSATAMSPVARYSFVGADPRVVIRAKGLTVELNDLRNGTTVQREGRALDFVAELLDIMRQEQDDIYEERQQLIDIDLEELPPFRGGAAGYIGYEYGGVLEQLPKPETDDVAIPDVVIGLYDWVIAWDHAVGRAWIIGNNELQANTVMQLLEEHSMASVSDDQADTYKAMGQESPMFRVQPTLPPYGSTFTAASYSAAVEQVLGYIAAGEIFQANLSQRFHASSCHAIKSNTSQLGHYTADSMQSIRPHSHHIRLWRL